MDKPSENTQYLTHEELQQECLNLLLRFDAFCKEHELRYSLDFGTLLGAVRHKGFIPWDDDIDLSMPRPDYDRLLTLQNEFPAGMALVHLGNSNLAVPFMKVVTESVHVQEHVQGVAIDECLWLDIFPMDGMPTDEKSLKADWAWVKRQQRRMYWCTLPNVGAWWKQAIKRTFALANSGHDVRSETAERLSSKLTVARYDASDRIGNALSPYKHIWTVERAAYEKLVKVEFEGHALPAMSCWDEQLTKIYGDYMALPPEEERTTHEVVAWRADPETSRGGGS